MGQRHENVALTRRQAVDAHLHQGQRLVALPRPPGVLQRRLHAVEQQLVVVGLFDEITGASLECPHHDRHIGMAADEDHRQRQATLAHRLLDGQPAQPRHTHIQQHTGGPIVDAGIEKRLPAGERQGLQAHRL